MLCTRQMACSTSFLSRQRDVIASFSFGAHAVYMEFFYQESYFKSLDFISSECVDLVLSLCYGVFIDLSG